MKKMFLDCGGHCGESVLKFVPIYPDHDFYTFEPNGELAQNVLTNLRSIEKPVFFYPGAVWTHDGFLDFFIGHDQGSTAVDGKVEFATGVQQVDYANSVRVPCLDLSSWILRSTSSDDEIVIKMDIEGGEYKVLPKMIEDGSIKRVKRLYCEWHQDRFPNIDRRFHDNLVSEVQQHTDLQEWM